MKPTRTRSRIALTRAMFGWAVRQMRHETHLAHWERAMTWGRLAARLGYAGTGVWASRALENGLLTIAAGVGPRPAPVVGAGPPTRWLHVLNTAYATGGHTVMLERWITWQSREARHRVLLIDQPHPVPARLSAALRHCGGTIETLNAGAGLVDRALELRNRAATETDIVVLHTHPDDVVATVGLGVPGLPAVMLMNHADHVFWVGASVADVVLNFRETSMARTRRHRGVSRSALLPIPIVPRVHPDAQGRVLPEVRRAARASLALPHGVAVLLTVGAADKYAPLRGWDFLDAAAEILRQAPTAHLVAVGPEDVGRWTRLRRETGGRLHAVGTHESPDTFFAAADIYLEGFPVGSGTALLEAGASGIPCVRAPRDAGPFHHDGAALSGVFQAADVRGYVQEALSLVADERERRRKGDALSRAVAEHHALPAWRRFLEQAVAGLPERHGVYPLEEVTSLPPDLPELWSDIYAAGAKQNDPVSLVSRAVTHDHLQAVPDLPVWRALASHALRGFADQPGGIAGSQGRWFLRNTLKLALGERRIAAFRRLIPRGGSLASVR
jgi:glycosyltransferase involved in cell wall biosynthesis